MPQDARKILEPLSKDQLVDVLQTVVVRDPTVLDAILSDVKPPLIRASIGLFVIWGARRSVFSSFGELEDVVVADKAIGKSRGYGFVTYKHNDGAILALKEPNKKIDGRIVVAQLVAARESGCIDVSKRKIYVGNTEQGAKSSLIDPMKNIDGHHVTCKLATDGKKGKVRGSIGVYGDVVPSTRSMPGTQSQHLVISYEVGYCEAKGVSCCG
ncbi:hypothetical protein L6452_08284 [Arctium lappa]|uniref:Uncharacterized protein n=1 Tax=Arctium lappa TaxID=4217 RepID=A0ACB9DHB8_ARCLA|nr:hypothetical protein L6452_08284 [Arctium lappa]